SPGRYRPLHDGTAPTEPDTLSLHDALPISVGRLAADARRAIVSGGARGIDEAAMRGAITHGGRAIGILADGLEKAALKAHYRERSEEHTSELQSRENLVCRLLLEKKKNGQW